MSRTTITHSPRFDNGVTTADGVVGKTGAFTGVFLDDEKSQAARANDAKTIPGFIQGRFTGYFLNGSVIGVYGVDKQ